MAATVSTRIGSLNSGPVRIWPSRIGSPSVMGPRALRMAWKTCFRARVMSGPLCQDTPNWPRFNPEGSCSDNVSGAVPEILRPLVAANAGDAAPYGADPGTERLLARFVSR